VSALALETFNVFFFFFFRSSRLLGSSIGAETKMDQGRCDLRRVHVRSVLTVGALVWCFGCSDVAMQPPASIQGGAAGTPAASGSGGAGGSLGGGGSGGAASGGAAGMLQASGSGGQGGSVGSGGDVAVSMCSPACSGTTPVCDDASKTCKTCTAVAGCTADKPLCDTAAGGGLGECKALELLAFYTPGIADLAHGSFAAGANEWFPSVAQANGFTYTASSNWGELASITAAPGRIVLFLDNIPYGEGQTGFQSYMDNGGAWMGFHVCAWTDDAAWSWYHDELLGSGTYQKNTWKPTSAELRVESTDHPVVAGLGSLFTSAPNEWYAFNGDLVNNPEIEILLAIDESSYPLGTNAGETWTSGYYPVAWANKNYKMVYVNMGHDDMDYGANMPLSSTFASPMQNQLFLNAIRYLGGVTQTF
jgi:hypothetical protein